jgi:hypothetical protein
LKSTAGLVISLTAFRLFIDLTPFIPLSLKGEGEIVFKRGANAPLKHPIYFQREGEEILERGSAPLLPTLPLPLLREGGQGDRLLNNL